MSCGTGNWAGPLPGDPDNNSILSAVPAFGGIDVSWTYPNINPHAVAHVLLYRGISDNYAASVKQATVAGNTFYDKITGTAGLRYYYWIQVVSVNGTVGAAIGPASAVARQRIEDTINDLSGKIELSTLGTSLRTEIDLITTIGLSLTAEQSARIADNSALGATISEIQASVEMTVASLLEALNNTINALLEESLLRSQADIAEANARVEAVTLESIARINATQDNAYAALEATLAANGINAAVRGDVALVRSELNQNLVEGILAEASQRLLLVAKLDTDIGTTLAAVTEEATARSTAISAEAVLRETLAAKLLGPDGTGLTAGLIYTDRTTRATQDNALAQQITLLSAGAGEQFDWKAIWYFDSGTESWGGNGAPTAASGFLRPANQASGAYVESPAGVASLGATYNQLRLRVRKVGSPVWAGYVWWRGVADTTWDAGRRVAMEAPDWAPATGIGLVTVNPAWAVLIDKIRVDMSSAQTATDYFELDWVAIGRPSPGASSAQLLTTYTVLADADTALVEDYTALHSQVNDPVTGVLKSVADIVTHYSTKAGRDSAIATAQTTLAAKFGPQDVFRQATAPTQVVNHTPVVLANGSTIYLPKLSIGSVWYETDNGNKPHTWDGLGWVYTPDLSDTATSAFIDRLDTAFADPLNATTSSIMDAVSAVTDPVTGLLVTQAAILNKQTTQANLTEALAKDSKLLITQSRKLDESVLRGLLTADKQNKDFIGTVALVREDLTSRIIVGEEAEAIKRLELLSVVNGNQAALTSNYRTFADQDIATSDAITTLSATVAGNLATVLTEYRTAVTQDFATAGALTALASVVAGNQADALESYRTYVDQDVATANAVTALRSSMEGAGGSVGLLTADLEENYYTKVTTDGAISSAGTLLRAYSDLGVKVFNQVAAPTVRGVNTTVTPNVNVPLVAGDIWVNSTTAVQNRWSGSAWEVASDTSAFNAWVDNTYNLNLANLTDGKIESWFTTSDPSSTWTGTDATHTGDLWYSTASKLLKRWGGTSWTTLEDQVAIDAATAASTAQETADGKINTYVSAAPPTATAIGDLWIDSDDENRLYRWDGLSWVSLRDANASAVIANLEQTKIGYATKAGIVFDNGGVITDKGGVDAWNTAHPADLAIWHVGLPLATAIKQLSISDGASSLTLEQRFTAQKSVNGDLYGQYAVKIDAGGRVAGFGLSSTSPVAGVGTSSFIVNADTFSVSRPLSFSGTAIPTATLKGQTWFNETNQKIYKASIAGANEIKAGEWVLDVPKYPFIVDTVSGEVFMDQAVINKLTFEKITDSAGVAVIENGVFRSNVLDLDWEGITGTTKPADGATRNVYKGAWVTATAYLLGDSVLYDGNTWECIAAHTSSVSITPPTYPTTSNTQWNIVAIRGQGQVKGVAFYRGASATAPTGGSFTSPNPTTAGWSDGIPADDNTALWMSSRLFTSDGVAPQQSEWTAPAKIGTPSTGTKSQFSVDGSSLWHDVPAVADAYMRTGTSTDNGATWAYSGAVKIKGETGNTGATGAQGTQGIQGSTGAAGTTYYTWVKYADSATAGMSDFPSGKAYLGIAYNKTTATESAAYADYSWSLIQGTQGIQGATGSAGTTTYTWIKYATSITGTGLNDSASGMTHIGIAVNKTTATESTTATDYTWALIKGDTGATGAQGIQGATGAQGIQGLIDTANTYTLGTNGGFYTGSIARNASTGVITGTGVAMTGRGIAAAVDGVGTFNLNGTTGAASFSGALSAATGTFAGTLTAAAVNAVNTLNIAGNAVTVPLSFSNDAYMTDFTGPSAPVLAGSSSPQFMDTGYISMIVNAVVSGGYTNCRMQGRLRLTKWADGSTVGTGGHYVIFDQEQTTSADTITSMMGSTYLVPHAGTWVIDLYVGNPWSSGTYTMRSYNVICFGSKR